MRRLVVCAYVIHLSYFAFCDEPNSNSILPVQLLVDGFWCLNCDPTGDSLYVPTFMVGNRVNVEELKYYKGTRLRQGDDKYIFRCREKYGYCKTDGTLVVEAQFDHAEVFSNGFAAVAKFGVERDSQDLTSYHTWGLINDQGEIVVPMQYEAIGNFSEGLVVAAKDGKAGFIDAKGKVIVPFKYGQASRFSEGRAIVGKGDSNTFFMAFGTELGIIDKNGNEILSPTDKFRAISDFRNGLACFTCNNEFRRGYLNKWGEIAIKPEYDYAETFCEGFGFVAKFIPRADAEDKIRVADDPPVEDDKVDTDENANAHQNDALAVQNPFAWKKSEMMNFEKEFQREYRVEATYLNREGNPINTVKYEDGTRFVSGMAAAKLGGSWGIIGQNGKWIVKPSFEAARAEKKRIVVYQKGSWWTINKTGQPAKKLESDDYVTLDPATINNWWHRGGSLHSGLGIGVGGVIGTGGMF